MLRTQRERFQEYLTVLDRQQDVIVKGDTETLISYVDLEEQIVKDIFTIQKVIDPLERSYRDLALSDGDNPETAEEAELRSLKVEVEGLKKEAAANAERNRNLLSRRMMEVRSEIKSLRGNPHAARLSVYADSGAPLMIDIKG
jgi:hypothetical protein